MVYTIGYGIAGLAAARMALFYGCDIPYSVDNLNWLYLVVLNNAVRFFKYLLSLCFGYVGVYLVSVPSLSSSRCYFITLPRLGKSTRLASGF